MSTAALDINDTGIVLVKDGKLLGASPGYALFGRDAVLIGEAAQRSARLEPLLIDTRFWLELDQQPLLQRGADGRSHADLVYLQLAQIQEQLGDVQSLVCAVPATMRAVQAGLLLSIARECRLPLTGFIDAAVAAASAWPERGRLIYLDMHLHQAVATAVQVDDEVRFERSENAPRAGLLALYELWMRSIARRYVTTTRFDPLHEARGEQALFDSLPSWLEQLARQPSVEFETQIADDRHRATFTQEEFRLEAAAVYGQILKTLRHLRRAGQPVTIALSSSVANLPGLAEQLAELRDCRIVAFPPGAAACAAALHTRLWSGTNNDLTKEDGAELLRTVPRLDARQAASLAPLELVLTSDRAEAAPPTHVLYRGQAYALSEQPLLVGTAPGPTLKPLQIIGANAGVSRHHCSLFSSPTSRGAMVVDHSRYGTWLNDEIVIERAPLRAGDRLHVGRPGVTLELIAID